jgi:hypothetical protein
MKAGTFEYPVKPLGQDDAVRIVEQALRRCAPSWRSTQQTLTMRERSQKLESGSYSHVEGELFLGSGSASHIERRNRLFGRDCYVQLLPLPPLAG